jgi:hypothetical protein
MARMFPRSCPDGKDGSPLAVAERQMFERLAETLGPEWAVIHDCEIGARGDSGAVEFVLVHRSHGIALLGLAEPGEDADPEPVAEAMAAMLDEIGFLARFGGRPAIVAKSVPAADLPGIAGIVEALFAGRPEPALGDPTWPDWLVRHLVPAVAAPPPQPRRPSPADTGELHLRPPQPEEAWRVAGGAVREPAAALPAIAERIPVSQPARPGPTLWTGMGLAVVVVALVLAGMALLSHGNG